MLGRGGGDPFRSRSCAPTLPAWGVVRYTLFPPTLSFFLLLSSFFHTPILSAPPPPLSYHHSRITAPTLLSTLTVNNCSCFSYHHFSPPYKNICQVAASAVLGRLIRLRGGDVQTRQTFKLTFLSYVRICTYCSNTIFKMFSVVININR